MTPQEEKQLKLDHRYLRMARIWAENSYCKRRQVGALIVKDKMIISDGYNGTPSGFENVVRKMTLPNLTFSMLRQMPSQRLPVRATHLMEQHSMSPPLHVWNVQNSSFSLASSE